MSDIPQSEFDSSFILDDEAAYRGKFSKVCTFCIHYQVDYTCKAFEKIPLDVWMGHNKHTEPIKGDHGIQFERIKQS